MTIIEKFLASVNRTVLTLLISIRALQRNKLRSGLTILGIVIGVAAMVAMVAVGNGARVRIESQVASLGENLLTVFAGSRRLSGVDAGLGSSSTITLGDAEAIRCELPEVVAISPEVTTSTQAIANGRNWSTSIIGESDVYLGIRNWTLSSGSMFAELDVRSTARVAVIGSKVAHELFGPLNPLSQIIRIKNIPFTIIGVLTTKGSGMGGQNQDDRIIVPFTTVMKRLTGDQFIRSINVQVDNSKNMALAQEQLTQLLRQRHRIVNGANDDFNIFNQQEISDTVKSISRIITIFLGSIASISLIVGGIGIMNIMLVSVTERTREIGIRMAIGAQPSDIRKQFLIEAIVLTLLGCLFGIMTGCGSAKLVGYFIQFNAVISTPSVIIAVIVCFFIGVVFGYYPARQAAALNPIDALRFE